jgi:putative aldouronate transport system substrate-binding protein
MKKSMWKKGMAAVFAAALAVGTLAGCGGGSKQTDVGLTQTGEDGVVEGGRYTLDENTPAWKSDTKENTKLTWYVNAEWWNTDWGNDVVTKKIKDDLKLDVEFLVGDDTKLNTFFAGGDMPDIITVFDSNSSVAQKADTWAYALQDLADNYDPYFYKVASDQTLSWFSMDDGKTYGYPDYSNTQEDYDGGDIFAKTAFVIRNDVYEALGKPSMGTQEEFLNVLGEIKEKYPDLIPLGFNNFETDGTSSLGDVLQDFLGVPIANDDNTFYDRNMDEDYLSWIKTFNEAYRDGYISDDSFTDDNTAWQEKESIGKYACIMMDGTVQQSGFLTTFASSDPDAAYIAIDGPQSTKGNAPKLNQAGISGWMITYVSKTCKDPAKAIQIYTYLLDDDGQILTNYGIEGETYEINADGKYELTEAAKELRDSDNDRFKKEMRLGEFIPFGHDRYKALSDDAYPDAVKQMQEWGIGKLYPHFILENTDPDTGSNEARAYSAIKTNWATTLVGMIRANDDAEFDSILEAHKQFRADNDWDAIVKERNEKMQKNAEKLNTK